MTDAARFFHGGGAVQETLHRITARLHPHVRERYAALWRDARAADAVEG